ncbi:MAG: hypothetical protein ACLVJO_01395 [[Clostridium] scindens]
MKREKVLQDYALGRCDYHFEFLRRRNDGMAFWGSTNMRTSQNPETGDVIIFFYTSDLTEQKMQELLLKNLRHWIMTLSQTSISCGIRIG